MSISDAKSRYEKRASFYIVDVLYCGFFGNGKNVTLDWLNKNTAPVRKDYRVSTYFTKADFVKILSQGGVSEDEFFIEKNASEKPNGI